MSQFTLPQTAIETGAICGIGTITSKPQSHTFGWSKLWGENLGVPVNHTCEPIETVFFDHGVNYGNSLNLFGGYGEKQARCIRNLVQAKRVYSLDIDMPKYDEMFRRRKDVEDDELMDQLKSFCDKAVTLKSTDLQTDWLTIGDSHTGAWAPHGSMIVRENGKTLNSQVRSDFQWVKDHLALCPQIKGVTLVFGNIDIRHHIIRLGVDWRPMWDALVAFGESLDIEVKYACPWPIECESRRIPKSGWYKGNSFSGSQRERRTVQLKVRDFLGGTTYPESWLDMDPLEYAKTIMEKPGSVHLSPTHYLRQNWGVDS